MRDLAIVLLAAGVGIVLTLGGCWAREGWRRRPWVDVLDMVEPSPPVVIKPLRCICAARLSFCACAIDGERNPRGAGRGRFRAGETEITVTPPPDFALRFWPPADRDHLKR